MKVLTVLLLVSFSVSVFAQGLAFSDSTNYQELPKKQLFNEENVKRLPTKIDLSAFVPTVMDQENTGICVGVASGYYLRTMLEAIKLNITDKSKINALRFSPTYLYNAIKTEDTSDCKAGTEISRAFLHLQKTGIVNYDEKPFPNCQKNEGLQPAEASKILDFVTLFTLINNTENKINATKKALAEKLPVVVGVEVTPSLSDLGFWQSIWLRILRFFGLAAGSDFGLWKPEKSDILLGGHAVCLTGYDDAKFGGAFQAVNSYGKNWGDSGFFWIRYEDFFKYAKYGYQAFPQILTQQNEVQMAGGIEVVFSGKAFGEAVPFVKESNGVSYPTYRLRDSQPTGTTYKINVNVTETAYLYFIAQNSTTKRTTKLFPEGFAHQPPIGKNTIVQFPDEKTSFVLTQPIGTEQFLALFSAKEIPDIDRYIRQIDAADGDFRSRVESVFSEVLVPAENIGYDGRNMSFKWEEKTTGSVVPLIVTIDHVAGDPNF